MKTIRILTAIILSVMFVIGNRALAVSAADRSVSTNCPQCGLIVLGDVNITYTNASADAHQLHRTYVFDCSTCHAHWVIDNNVYESEPHTVVGNTCIKCHYVFY